MQKKSIEGNENLEENNNEIKIYPNPTTGEIVVSGQLSDVSVEVFDIVGKKQESRKSEIGKSEIEIDISHLSNGIYFLKIDNKMYKIIKQ